MFSSLPQSIDMKAITTYIDMTRIVGNYHIAPQMPVHNRIMSSALRWGQGSPYPFGCRAAHTLPGGMMNEMMIMTMTIMTVAYSMRRAWFAARPNDQAATVHKPPHILQATVHSTSSIHKLYPTERPSIYTKGICGSMQLQHMR